MLSRRKRKLKTVALSPHLEQGHLLASALVSAGQYLLQAAAILQGKRTLNFAPVASLSLPAASVTVIETVNEFLLAKARSGRSDRYLRRLRVSLGSFSKARAFVGVRDLA
jgi:hypothetical protein